METLVFFAVLASAALHAGWNAVVKVGLDLFLSIALISITGALACLIALPWVAFPTGQAWPWLIASVFLHVGYKLFLIQAYRAGDLGQVYPIARGAAPLLVALVMMTVFEERLSPLAMAGIGVLACGVGLMAARGGRRIRLETRAVIFALGTAVFIAAYTITDGLGARLNGSPYGYIAWLFALDGLLMLALVLRLRGLSGFTAMVQPWQSGLAAGAMSIAAYAIIIWAMSTAPIALVAALRESSVLFAAGISMIILREPMTLWRGIAASAIVAGIALTRIG